MKSSPVTSARSTPSVVLMASCVPICAPGFSVSMHNQMTCKHVAKADLVIRQVV